ncbi:MAG: ABC transporter permease [Spirochaetaceae bacterium]|jgi:peptide/nickel transport system permease protein|nr:ABC transporter permease [Spirochaetaceae bacterium]
MDDYTKWNTGFRFSRRLVTLGILIFAILVLTVIFVSGLLTPPAAYEVNFQEKNLIPGIRHPFGTDWLGRDMLARTIKGLSTSIIVGMSASVVSTIMAMILGVAAATMGRKVDTFVTWFVDLFLSIPHMILLILISIAVGKGFLGVLIGVAATHWTSLTRVIRAEVLALRSQPYITASRALGKGHLWIGRKHILPHVLPQFIVALILLFPHAILHEAAITFLGFGLSPEQPAIGVILSESMQYLTAGMWYLAFFPGLCLLVVVMLFDALGENLRILLNPGTSQT